MARKPSSIVDGSVLDAIEAEARGCIPLDRPPTPWSAPGGNVGGPITRTRKAQGPGVRPEQLVPTLRKLAAAARRIDADGLDDLVAACAQALAGKL